MKKLLPTILIFVFVTSLTAQEDKMFSIEAGSIYYLKTGGTTPLFSYGFSLQAVQRIHKFAVTLGVNYSHIKYELSYPKKLPTANLTGEKLEISYLDFPLIFSFPDIETGKWHFNALAGMVLHKQLRAVQTLFYDTSPTMVIENNSSPQRLGMSFRGGIGVTRFITKYWYLSLSPYFDIPIIEIYDDNHGKTYSDPERGYLFGVNLSVGYMIF